MADIVMINYIQYSAIEVKGGARAAWHAGPECRARQSSLEWLQCLQQDESIFMGGK